MCELKENQVAEFRIKPCKDVKDLNEGWCQAKFISRLTDGRYVCSDGFGSISIYDEYRIQKPAKIAKFHISYFEQENDIYSKGVDIEAKDMMDALIQFKDKYGVDPEYINKKN